MAHERVYSLHAINKMKVAAKLGRHGYEQAKFIAPYDSSINTLCDHEEIRNEFM
jgi:hypothetical protein